MSGTAPGAGDDRGRWQITIVAKSGGPLTKRISLAADGSVVSDGSACVMAHGGARRVTCNDVGEFADLISGLRSNEAITLGALRPDQPDQVTVVTRHKLNGHDRPGLVCRTQEFFCFAPGEGFALLDYDTKGMPAAVKARIDEAGGFWAALVSSVLPQLAGTARVTRASTSAGLVNAETGRPLAGSGGIHALVAVRDASDTDRFTRTLHDRCWLAGLGWQMVGADGHLLERSIVDRMVGAPERLIFEGPPVLVPPVAQDARRRSPAAVDGESLDTMAHCPPLTAADHVKLRDLRAKEAARLAPEADQARRAFVAQQTRSLVDRGMTPEQAARSVGRQCEGVLRPGVVLPFDDAEFAGTTVGTVLADPAKFDGATLADPNEGVDYGVGKAKIMRRADGSLWVHSFAHGRTSYELRYDYRTAKDALEGAAPEEAANLFIRYVLAGDLDEAEVEMLRNITSKISGIGKRALNNDLKNARERLKQQQEQQKRDRRTAARQASEGVTLEDFYAYMPAHTYIYTPTREPWPGTSVDGRIDGVVVGVDDDGRDIIVPASVWLDRNKPVEQMTWAPGLPMIIANRLIAEGGWIERDNVSCFNLYRPPIIGLGDAAQAGRWLDHIHKIYPDDAEYIIKWLAHRRQYPQDKINHALVLSGEQGIGKDTMLEPVKYAVGPWNFSETSPKQMVGRFNGFLKAVIVRVSEARDLGEVDRFQFYEHMKVYTAAPPDVLRVDEKHLREHNILNCCGVIITTNHKTDGIYLPSNDRRHYVAWSDFVKEDFEDKYWTGIWEWYRGEGYEHVTAYLDGLDLSRFDAKAPPPKTAAFWEIVNAGRTSEDAELADVLDNLGRPDTVTKDEVVRKAPLDFKEWLEDRRNNGRIPHRFAECGYVAVRNTGVKDGMWVVDGRRQVIYARADLPAGERWALAGERSVAR